MISFAPTQEQTLTVQMTRKFASNVLRPAARTADETEALPDTVLRQSWQLGLIATQIPEAYGGGGAPRSPVTNALVLEALAFGDPGLALAITHSAGFAFAVLDQGSEEQKRRLLPSFCGGDPRLASLAVMEPVPGFDPYRTGCVATPTDNGFILSGTKCCVPLAESASQLLVVARSSGSAAGERLAAFVVASDAPGLSMAREKNLGLRALPTATVVLDEIELEHGAELGNGTSFELGALLDRSRVASAALLLGLSCAVMEYAIPYAKQRRAFGEFIAQKQAIAFMLADMRIEIDAMRFLTWKAATELEQGRLCTRAAQFAHSYAAEQAMKVADDGLQVLGGHGYIREHPLELWYRAARTLSVLEGAACL